MTSTEEQIMSKVMKLLALAADESTTPQERKLAEEHADRLMAKHMIDRFEAAERLRKGDTEARKPIHDTWTITTSDADSEFDGQIIDMMTYVLEHCGVRVNPNAKYNNECDRVYSVVGFQEDIAYAERIWFNVFKAFVSNINPKWSLNETIERNAYVFASAGMSWKDQVLLAEREGDTRLEWPWRYQNDDPNKHLYVEHAWRVGKVVDPGNVPWGQSIHKLKRACKKYCIDEGVDYPYAPGAKLRVATRNSFARSYRATIKSRLDEMRAKSASGFNAEGSGGQFALALRDTKARVDEEFYKIYPEYDPDNIRKKQEARDANIRAQIKALTPQQLQQLRREAAAEQARWARQGQKARRNFGVIREDPANRVDGAAWARGQQAANSVNLRADAEVKKETRKGIN